MKSKKEYSLQNKYNLSAKEYSEMQVQQNYRCKICGVQSDYLFVDHDHETGKVRSLLCSSCNSGLGFFKDDPNILRKSASYILDYKLLHYTYECLNGKETKESKITDWRKIRPSLSPDQVLFIANNEPKDIVKALAQSGFAITPRTASNWRVYAAQEMGVRLKEKSDEQ